MLHIAHAMSVLVVADSRLLRDQLPEAAAAASCSLAWMPATSVEFERKSCSNFHSPLPGVPPNAGGSRSDISKRTTSAFATAVAALRVMSSGYTAGSTFLFGELKPPSSA